MRFLGYTRVNSVTDDAGLQTDALMSAGVLPHDVRGDVIGGSKVDRDRPGMRALMADAAMGDAVVVWRIDRLGRSLSEVLDTVTMMVERGLYLLSVQDGIDSRTASGRLMVDFTVSLAKYERHLTGERVAAGMSSARRAGKRLGRPPLDRV